MLAVSGALSIGAVAQTTSDGPGPSEQPSAPMEVGQPQAQNPDAQGPNMQGPNMQGPDMQPSDAQPTEAQPGGPSGEAPARTDQGVARVSLIHGDVSTQRGDSGDWSAVALNQPVMTADKVSTGDNARTELQLDFANILRIGANSKVNIANLTHKNIQIQLGQGLATYTVSKDSEAEPEIDTPNVSIHPAHHDGVFRVEVRPDGDTIVIVRQGEAQIATPQGSAEVRAGEMATVRGDVNSAQYKISEAPERDDWDRWNSDRDHLIQNANSWRHTNRRYTGAQDLDAYGSWKNVPDYGDVWVPNEPDGWVPYRNGNWTYEPYYGWTWVGYEPWGWAPYHYGRWFPYGGAWAWWPGPVYAGYNPFWAPAYVSFWGWGGGFGFGFGFGGWGGFGWLPIGPCDWFHPWWGGYGGRFGWVGGRGFYGGRYGGFSPLHNGMRYSNIANMRDGHVSRALSAVNAGHFGAGRVSAVAATREQVSGARMMAGNLPVVPSRASLSASGRAAAPSTIRNTSQSFYGTHNTAARPASFQQQTSNLRQSMAQNHVGAIPAGGRSSGEFSARGASSGMQRPAQALRIERPTVSETVTLLQPRGARRCSPALSVRSTHRALPAALPHLLLQKIAEDSGRSRRHRAARHRVAKPIHLRPGEAVVAGTGIAPLPAVRWDSAAVRTPAPMVARVRNWICTSRSCAVRRMADIPVVPLVIMVAIAAQPRATAVRELRAPVDRELRVTVAAAMPPAVVPEGMSAAAAVGTPAVVIAKSDVSEVTACQVLQTK